ncbi:hypothetical protein Pint_28151 [Pistacia integerrima]|uniref:Uncharacterized protein n=1 Tax=Pistacia integerrima TaxID=434235 RepID=A0ACC0YRU6_9ROSI|nr:hypothetical protein Pint_28151 [Pistacia integerrima]
MNKHPQTHHTDGQNPPAISLYEQSRDQRIKENLQKMQKLGLGDLSLKLKSLTTPKGTPRNTTISHSPRNTGPVRRSSRLQNVTPISYSEVVLSKKDKSLEDEDVKLREGPKPEVYTEEHEKLLGNTERRWTCFVDGYGGDGRRIYDAVKGKTCHQCRQKTLGHRTHCCQCNKVQGQFCGDCLYMRYGEHILEAKENPNWICPPCRGICNCSFCRQDKGWCPTGSLYRKISSLGYKSVAHYLIQTRRSQTNLEKDPETENQVSAKRSLPFPNTESKDSLQFDENLLGTAGLLAEDRKKEDVNIEKHNKVQVNPISASNYQISTKRSLPFSDSEEKSVNDNISVFQLEDNLDKGVKGEQERKLNDTDEKHYYTNNIPLESCTKAKKKRAAIEPNLDSIAGRLRRRKANDHEDMDSTTVNKKNLDVNEAVSNILSEKELEKEKEMQITDDNHGCPKLQSKPAVAIGSEDRDCERLADVNGETSNIK